MAFFSWVTTYNECNVLTRIYPIILERPSLKVLRSQSLQPVAISSNNWSLLDKLETEFSASAIERAMLLGSVSNRFVRRGVKSCHTPEQALHAAYIAHKVYSHVRRALTTKRGFPVQVELGFSTWKLEKEKQKKQILFRFKVCPRWRYIALAHQLEDKSRECHINFLPHMWESASQRQAMFTSSWAVSGHVH